MRRIFSLLLALLVVAAPAGAQPDAFTLPADLYVLLNDGIVQRFSPEAGIEAITPEGAFVVDFGIDASGERIAYRTQEGLVIAPLDDAGAGQMVDALAGVPPLRGRGQTIAWSPGGEAVAYTTQEGARIYYTTLGAAVSIDQPRLLNLSWSPDGTYLAAEAEHRIWWIYRRNGTLPTLRAAVPSSVGVEWLNEGLLLFAPETGGLFTMDLENANTQAEMLPPDAEYRLPALAPDGDLLFFRRDPDEVVPEGYGQLVAVVPGMENLEVRGATPIDLGGNLRWAPGATMMIAFEGGILAVFDPGTGQGFPLPLNNTVGYAWGPYRPPAAVTPTPTAEATEAMAPGG